ncbi:ester cyclase [Halarcobacter ebronensis]|uniref:Ester cyclase n=1 Tax=Halarcobacter ebronensis TaxID=1462615 RepID=A0A4V1M0M7_9BACT|nr:ester cyclase [Halarcobacter ebronensis]QKF82816.1 SnoaL-like polyketide cyclase [Halarcobacter ebronensis]RXK06838.1 hypothetical protein CRV07_05250 [Halarcobacter ebronensis]
MKNTNKELVKRYYDEIWNKQNRVAIDELLDDDITFRGTLNIETQGKKEFEEYMTNILTAIPNLYHGIEMMVEENGVIAVRAVYNGTHKGKLFNYEPTNNRIKYNGASFFRFKDGKISNIWVLGDLISLYEQLEQKK